MKRIIYTAVIGLSISSLSLAQDKLWTMDECMKYAVENSPKVKIAKHEEDTNKAEQLYAFGSFLPSIGADTDARWSFGRSIDPETNTYNNTSTFNNSYSLYSSLPLFRGGQLINQWKLSTVNRLLGREASRQAEDELAINTMQAYIDAMFYHGTVKLAAEKQEESAQLLLKTRRLEELGLKGKADVAQIEAQAAADDYNLTHQQNLYEIAMLTLKEFMNYDSSLPFLLDTTAISTEFLALEESAESIYEYAADNNPIAVQSGLTLRGYKLRHLMAKGSYFPTISLNAGVSTNYFDNLKSENDPASFGSQFNNNRGQYVALSVSVPLFDRFSRRTEVRRARNNVRIAEERRTETLRQLRTTVEKAVTDRDGYLKEIIQMEKQANANDLAYKLSSRKYEEGLLSPLDLQTSSNLLIESKVNLLQKRLLYIVKTKQVQYYKGEPLVL